MITSDYNYIGFNNRDKWHPSDRSFAQILIANWIDRTNYRYIIRLKSNTVKTILIYRKQEGSSHWYEK